MLVFQVWAWGKPRFSVPILSSSSLCRPTRSQSPCLYRVSPQIRDFLLRRPPNLPDPASAGGFTAWPWERGESRASGVREAGTASLAACAG